MGSRKQLVLAALVSMVMVLSFAIGLAPSQTESDTNSATAAIGATAIAISVDGVNPVGDSFAIPVGGEQDFSVLSLSDGRLIPAGEAQWSLATDGAALLSAAPNDFVATVAALTPGEAGLYVSAGDAVDVVELTLSALKEIGVGGGELESVSITSPVDGAIIIIPQGATDPVPLTLTAETNSPDDTDSVEYKVDGASEGTATQPPYAVLIDDLRDLLKTKVLHTVVAIARSYAGYDIAKPYPGYEEFSDSADFSVIEQDADPGGDGIPDDPFGLNLGAGDTWRASVDVDGEPREVAAVGLGDLTKQVPIPSEGVTVSIQDPLNLARVVTVEVPAGLVDEDEIGVLLFMAADDLDTLLGATEAADVDTPPTGGLVVNGWFVEVSVLISGDGGTTFSEIDDARLADNPVVLTMDGLVVVAGDNARFFSHPTDILSDPVTVDVDATGVWQATALGTTVQTTRMTARLDSLSVMAPFLTPGHIQILSVAPPQDFSIGGEDVVITMANLPTGITAADLAVSIDGNALANVAVADPEISGQAPAASALAAPASSADVDVRVELLAKAVGDFDVLAEGFTYRGPQITTVSPELGSEAGGTVVTVTGAGFDASLSAKLGGAPIIGLGSFSVGGTSFTGTTTYHDQGRVGIQVRNDKNYTGAMANVFSYVPQAPVLTSVIPAKVFSDGGYTLRLGGAGFVDPEIPFKALPNKNLVFFTDSAPGPPDSPTPDVPAVNVEFLDDTRLDALTPSVSGADEASIQGVFVNTVIESDVKKFGKAFVLSQFSGVAAFKFLGDPLAAAMAIYGIYPEQGRLSGGNEVRIEGQGFPSFVAVLPVTTGHVMRIGGGGGPNDVGLFHAPSGPTAFGIELYLYRAGDASANHPAAIDFDIVFDPTVLSPFINTSIPPSQPNVVTLASDNLGDWYDKGIVADDPAAGVVSVVIAGLSPYALTTFDDQKPSLPGDLHDPSTQENPFLLGTVFFEVIGSTGATTMLEASDMTMADTTPERVLDARRQNGFFNVGDTQVDPSAGEPPIVLFGANAAVVLDSVAGASALYNDEITAEAPRGDRPGWVDVRVEDASNDEIIAISRADSMYSTGTAGNRGYKYLDTIASLYKVTPPRGWGFGGIIARLQGNGFSATKAATLVYFGGQQAQIADSIVGTVSTASNMYVIVPPLPLASFGGQPSALVDVTVQAVAKAAAGYDPFVLPDAFTYVHSEDRTETVPGAQGDVTYTAFQFDGSQPSGDIILELPGTVETATLVLPTLTAAKQAYDTYFGLARVTQEPTLFSLDGLEDDAIPNIFNFDLHLYAGVYPFVEQTWVYFQGGAEATVDYPVPAGALSLREVVAGVVRARSIYTSLDYTSFRNPLFAAVPGVGTPHPFVTQGDVATNAAGMVTRVETPLTSLSAFALRTGYAPEEGCHIWLLAAAAALIGLLAGGDGDGGGPCFIATAAYGTPLAGELDTLRAFRDAYLLNNAVGTAFTDLYYRMSPALADVIARSPVLAAAVRLLLVPVIFVAKLVLALPHVSLALGMMGAAWASLRYRRRRKA